MSNTNIEFTTGDQVRVRRGMADPDFPEIPLGGWAGEITEDYEDWFWNWQ